MCKPTLYDTGRCDVYNKISKFNDIYYSKSISERDKDVNILNYRIKYIFENVDRCKRLSRFDGIYCSDYFFTCDMIYNVLVKLYRLGGFAKRNDAVEIAIKENKKYFFDSIVLGKKCKFFVSSATLKMIYDKPYYLYHVTRTGFTINDELLKTLFLKYKKAVMDDINRITFYGWNEIKLKDIPVESKVYFEKNCLFKLDELYKLMTCNITNTRTLISANYNFRFQFTCLIRLLIQNNKFMDMETLVYCLKQNNDYVPGYIIIHQYIEKKYFEIRRSLRRFVNKNHMMKYDLNRKYITYIFKSVYTGVFLDNNRTSFTKIIKNQVLPKYDKYFKKITPLNKILKKIKLYLNKHAGTKAVIKHDLSKIMPKDIAHHILLFY